MRIRLVRQLVVTILSVAFLLGHALSPALAVQRAQRIQPNDSEVRSVARVGYGYDGLISSIRMRAPLAGAPVPSGNVDSARAERVCARPCGYGALQFFRVSRNGVATNTPGAAAVDDVLMPNGSAIGKAGTNPTIREVTGGVADAEAMFKQLSAGGKVVSQTPAMTRVELPNGGFVQIRTVMSKSANTAATIDVNIPGLDITKVKFNP